MIDTPNASPKVVTNFLRERAESLLRGRRIWSLDSYGWNGPDDYDDEMIGHAMWQTDSLYFHFLDAHFSATHAHGPPPRILEPWEQFLIHSGGDFEGLIEAARLSIGLTLFQQQAAERDHYEVSSLFQVHLISSIVLLSTASDRLRDLFIAAVFHVSTDHYQNARVEEDRQKSKNECKATWYSGPFYEALQPPIPASHSTESFAALPGLADQIFTSRSIRNQVVHTVATELGRQQRELARKKKPDEVNEAYSYDEVQKYQKQAEAEHQERVETDVARLVSWYELLMVMSNHVFIVENTLRRGSRV